MALPKLVLVAAALALAASTTAAQEDVAPAAVQYALFMKILTLDRELDARVGEELVIGVVYQPQVRESWLVRDDFVRVMAASPIRSVRGIPVRCVPIALESPRDLGRHIERHGLDALYVSPLRAVEIGQIASVARPEPRPHARQRPGVRGGRARRRRRREGEEARDPHQPRRPPAPKAPTSTPSSCGWRGS